MSRKTGENGKPPKIIPVILSGGAGIRLWPLSRRQKPKQFIALDHTKTTPFEHALTRAQNPNLFEKPLIICLQNHRFLVRELLEKTGTDAQILMEPCARNTAPAIAVAAFAATQTDPDALMLVTPSDHHIPDITAFHTAIQTAEPTARAGAYVLFAIPPTSAHTGYGYIEEGAQITPSIAKIKAFKEKPDLATAQTYLEKGGHSWNSGIFLIHAQTLLDELQTTAPDIYNAAKSAWETHTDDLDDHLLNAAFYEKAPSISLDYCIMENTSKAFICTVPFPWSDIGTWDTLAAITPKTAQNNVFQGDVIAQNCTNTYIRSEGPLIYADSLADIIAVAMNDVILITQKGASENVEKIVETLNRQGRNEAKESRITYRPWGSYEITGEGEGYKTKRIIVKPAKRLSLQSHQHRSEHWVIVQGVATVTLGDKTFNLHANQSVYVEAKTRHRLENKSSEDLIIIEVQTGPYLGEDDIERYDDDFGRTTTTAQTRSTA